MAKLTLTFKNSELPEVVRPTGIPLENGLESTQELEIEVSDTLDELNRTTATIQLGYKTITVKIPQNKSIEETAKSVVLTTLKAHWANKAWKEQS